MENNQPQAEQQAVRPETIVIQKETNALGITSFIFGILCIFGLTILFAPLALIFGFIGIGKEPKVWAILGLVLACIGLATSPMIWGIIGLSSIK